jgi:hypothetical protein
MKNAAAYPAADWRLMRQEEPGGQRIGCQLGERQQREEATR